MSDLMWNLFQALSPALVALVGWLSMRLAALIKANTSNAYLQGVLLRLNDAVAIAVRETQQVMVEQLKKTDPTGKLTETAKANAKAAAIATIKAHLGPKGITELATVFGVAGPALDGLLGARVEAAVAASKERSDAVPFPVR